MGHLSVPQIRRCDSGRSTTPLETLRLWLDRYGQRRALADLDDDRLRDLGLHRRDVERECAKPFWV